MIRLLLLRFWPALLPLAFYFGWLWARYFLLKKQGKAPSFSELISRTPLFFASLASLFLLLLCFLWLGLSQPRDTTGHYIPPHQENGAIVPGHVEP